MTDTEPQFNADSPCQPSDGQESNSVRVAVPGFAALYAAALELPHDLLHNDPDACADRLEAPALLVELL